MFIENNKSTNTSAKKKPIWCSKNTFPSCDWYTQQENMAPRGKFRKSMRRTKWNMMGDVKKHRKMAKNVVKRSKILMKLELTVSPIFWSNLKKVEISLAADTMQYKTLDLKSLLVRGFTGQNGPENET